ncbi:hypothetical protein [Herbaspirillum rubrisubalbicans]|uniref:Uncharacterized protein n=1 Tax=Herbaspirillum rubrisubalbicans TaxID=80842 RepID=A0AAD0UDN7_9BURK|nr:hypothetical protein [Herbaspirillum rubrisubalbicans]AYR24999.1 hypothetical protein RC54_14730 [Herbaspirillum rubrisubalbicans]
MPDRQPPSPAEPAAALLRPPGTPPVLPRAPLVGVGDHPSPVVEPDGTEDPWANADDGVVPGQGHAPHPFQQESSMHKPQDTPPVEVPPLDPTPPQDPIPHQNPSAGSR